MLNNIPLKEVANEANFLAPLHTTGRMASVLCEDLNYGKRLIAGELGTEDVWWEVEYVPADNKVRVTGTVQERAEPIKIVS